MSAIDQRDWDGWHARQPFMQALDSLPAAVMLFDQSGEVHYANEAARRLFGESCVDLTLDELIDGRQPVRSTTGDPYPREEFPVSLALAGQSVSVDDMELGTALGVLPVEAWASPILDDDGSIAFAVIGFRDISARRRQEREKASLYDDVMLHSRWLEAVREVMEEILAGEDPDEVLSLVARRARALVDGDTSSIGTPVSDDLLAIRAADGRGADALRGSTVPLAGSLMGHAIHSARTIATQDTSGGADQRSGVVHLHAGASVVVPLIAGGVPFGAICVSRNRGRSPFSADEVRIAQTFAEQAAVAVEYGRTQRELARLAVTEERQRIARDLHDGVIQCIFAVGMSLNSLAGIVAAPDIRTRIEGAANDLESAITDVRDYIFSLRPAILAGRHVGDALHAVARGMEAKTGVVTVVDLDERVAAAQARRADDLIHVVREAMSNVSRHAAATTCRIRLGESGGRTILEIEDDGRGFDLVTTPRTGDGLRNLEARAAANGGRLEIESELDRGTTLRVILPREPLEQVLVNG